MAEVKAPLLGADGQEAGAFDDVAGQCKKSSFAKTRRYLSVAALCLAGVGMLNAASYYRKKIVPSYFSSTTTGWGEASCYKNTGGTCYIQGCNADRKAECSTGHCWCKEGCVGSDGLCRADVSSYKLVASNFRLKNFYWKDQYMYAPRTWFMEQLRTTTANSGYADLWNLYELPGPMWVPYGLSGAFKDTPGYFLSPVEFPEYAAGIASTKMQAYVPTGGGGKNNKGSSGGIVIPVGSMFVVDLYHLTSRHLLANTAPFNPAVVMNSLCRPAKYPEAIEINGGFGQASWYVHTASWEVFGWVWSDPQEGGYWVPDPPLNISLPTCRR